MNDSRVNRLHEGRGQALIILIGLMVSLSCKPNDFTGASDKSKDEDHPKTDATIEVSEDDSVIAPENITGSYLACAVRKAPSETEPSMQLGCRLSEDTNHRKVDLEAFADDIQWSFRPSEHSRISILEQENIWHIHVDLMASTANLNQDILQNSTVSVSYRLKDSQQTITQESLTADTLRPIDDFNDFEAPAVLEQGITPEQPGPL